MDLNIMRVTKIEVKKRKDITGTNNFSIRDIVFHNLEYDWKTQEHFTARTEVTCFLEDKDVAKLIYNKE